MFGSMQVWKLHSLGDYISFFLYIIGGVFIFWLIIRRLNKQRTHENALARVVKRLKKICRPCEVFTNVTLKLPKGEKSFDAIMLDNFGVVLITVFEWGLTIYGGPDTQTWRREDSKRKEEFANPLIELRRGVRGVQEILGIPEISVTPLVVFADSYATPELMIGRDSFSVAFQNLKKWSKARREDSAQVIDKFPKVWAALYERIV